MDLSPFGGAQGPVAFVFHDGGTTPLDLSFHFLDADGGSEVTPELCAAETGGRVRVHVDGLPDIFDVRWQDSALCCDGAPGQLFVLPRTLRLDLGHTSLRWLLTGSCGQRGWSVAQNDTAGRSVDSVPLDRVQRIDFVLQ